MRTVLSGVVTQLEAILAEVEQARQRGGAQFLDGTQKLLLQLHSSIMAQSDDPERQFVDRFRACQQDVDKAELLYSSGFGACELARALGISVRRVYQLLRLARLPLDVKKKIRHHGLSERRIRPLLKHFTNREPGGTVSNVPTDGSLFITVSDP